MSVKQRTWLCRRRGGLSHQQVADMVGISRGYYTQIEGGDRRPSIPVARRLGETLGFNWLNFFEEQLESVEKRIISAKN